MSKILFFLLLLTSVAKAQNVNSKDEIYCDLRDFLLSEAKIDSSLMVNHNCISTILIYDILSEKSDLSVNFGVYAFTSTLVSDSFWNYLLKYGNQYFVFSAKDPILLINKIMEIREKYPDKISSDLTLGYITEIGKRKAIDLGNYLTFSKKFGHLEYFYPSFRYK